MHTHFALVPTEVHYARLNLYKIYTIHSFYEDVLRQRKNAQYPLSSIFSTLLNSNVYIAISSTFVVHANKQRW